MRTCLVLMTLCFVVSVSFTEPVSAEKRPLNPDTTLRIGVILPLSGPSAVKCGQGAEICFHPLVESRG